MTSKPAAEEQRFWGNSAIEGIIDIQKWLIFEKGRLRDEFMGKEGLPYSDAVFVAEMVMFDWNHAERLMRRESNGGKE